MMSCCWRSSRTSSCSTIGIGLGSTEKSYTFLNDAARRAAQRKRAELVRDALTDAPKAAPIKDMGKGKSMQRTRKRCQRPRVSEFRNLEVVLWDPSACIRMRSRTRTGIPVRSEGGISGEVKGSVPRFREGRQCVRGQIKCSWTHDAMEPKREMVCIRTETSSLPVPDAHEWILDTGASLVAREEMGSSRLGTKLGGNVLPSKMTRVDVEPMNQTVDAVVLEDALALGRRCVLKDSGCYWRPWHAKSVLLGPENCAIDSELYAKIAPFVTAF